MGQEQVVGTEKRRKLPSRNVVVLTGIAILALVLIVGGWYLFQPAPHPSTSGGPNVGDKAPDFTLRQPNGSLANLSLLRGHPVIINFWASTCAPCHQETPLLVQAYAQYHQQGLDIVGIDQAEDMSTIQSYENQYSVPYTLVADSDLHVADQYGQASPLPRTYFVDNQGVIQYESIGQLSTDTLTAGIHKILPFS